MNTYTSNDSLFSNINKDGGISLISKINQNSNGNFKLVDIVDIDWDGSTVYTYNDNGETTKNTINDSAEFLTIFQNTINRVESNNFNKYVQTIDNVKDYYDPETETWTTGYTDGLVTATDVTKYIIDNEYVVSNHLNNFSTELTNTYNSLYTELNNQTDNLHEQLDNAVVEYTTYISDLQNDLSDLTTTVGEHATYISNLENNLSSTQTSLTKRIDIHATDISSLQSGLSNLTNTVNNNINVIGEHVTYISDLQNDLSGLTTTVGEHATYISDLQNDLSDLTTTVGNHDTYISDLTLLGANLGIAVNQNKDNICAILEQTKSSLYYNCNDYMKVDYRGTTYYNTTSNQYTYNSTWTIQHMYFDEELTTFIPGLPYQDPFKAIVTFKMPLMFSGSWSHQQLVMCQDFIWGDGQDDHSVMCPKWYSFGGMEWGGSTLNYNVVKYTTGYPALYTNENIDVSFNISSTTKTDYFLTAFVYPLIRIKDANGRVYSPLLISAMDNTKTTINTKYTWMASTNPISTLERSIINPSYKENITNFYIEHITQINKTFFGNDGIMLPASSNELKSNRFQSFKGNNASNEGKVVQLDSVLKRHINNNDTIELLTIDEDGYTISCGKSNNYTDLLTNYNSYKEFINDKINNSIKNKYPWLF